ncbi:hypothetical protein GQ53DRAFT_362627 [Thozetella sp. PMI_491]|nr:hypothetical protein GQ53DRAFT_362627 [Thozetella sp. PMI_491]
MYLHFALHGDLFPINRPGHALSIISGPKREIHPFLLVSQVNIMGDGIHTPSTAGPAGCEAHSFKYQTWSALIALGVTPVFLVPAIFDARGFWALIDLKDRYPVCDPSAVTLPRFFPEVLRRNISCTHLLLMITVGITVYYSAAVTFFLWGAYRRPPSMTSRDRSGAKETSYRPETHIPGTSNVQRDLVILTAGSLLIAYAGSVRDSAMLFLVICPLLLNVHMILYVATKYMGHRLGR